MSRFSLVLGATYLMLALVSHALERAGSIRCDCQADCWCKRPGLRTFRWVFPVGHSTGCGHEASLDRS
ncbi:MAG: hypothetical protein M3401_14530 [Actinomycetota bacterium]|nr:hypothetical protein [Actinomycetota bacterium]